MNNESKIKLATKIVSDYFRLKPEQLRHNSRLKELAKARQIIVYILREAHGMNISYAEIGRYFGRNHSTMIYAHRTIQDITAIIKKEADTINELTLEYNRQIGLINNDMQLISEVVAGKYLKACETFYADLHQHLSAVKRNIEEDALKEGFRRHQDVKGVEHCLKILDQFKELPKHRIGIINEVVNDVNRQKEIID